MTNSEAYEAFVGSLTPEEFVSPFVAASSDPIAAAVDNLLADWPWEVNPPYGLRRVLIDYCSDSLIAIAL
jgi:hypothetical protein